MFSGTLLSSGDWINLSSFDLNFQGTLASHYSAGVEVKALFFKPP